VRSEAAAFICVHSNFSFALRKLGSKLVVVLGPLIGLIYKPNAFKRRPASFGAGGGLGLPIIGKLLGHTQASTTERYAHLDVDPLRRAKPSVLSHRC
jgi:integrase